MSSVPLTSRWDVHRLPRADDRVFLVTGGNAGIGYFIAEQLSATGATVVLGSRSPMKAEAARAAIRDRVPGARVRTLRLDLADLSSLSSAAHALESTHLDAVVHNAGVALDDPPRRETRDGHEVMFGTNHLGHFALTGWLMPLLAAAPAARVVTVGSFAAKSERLDLGDPQSRQDYRPKRTYGRSKLAQMYFALELDRRLRAAGSTVASVVAHPGGALDSLTPSRPPVSARTFGTLLRGRPPASSSRASTPAPGPPCEQCSTRPCAAASCGDRASSAYVAGLDSNRCGGTSPIPPSRRSCGGSAAT